MDKDKEEDMGWLGKALSDMKAEREKKDQESVDAIAAQIAVYKQLLNTGTISATSGYAQTLHPLTASPMTTTTTVTGNSTPYPTYAQIPLPSVDEVAELRIQIQQQRDMIELLSTELCELAAEVRELTKLAKPPLMMVHDAVGMVMTDTTAPTMWLNGAGDPPQMVYGSSNLG